MRRLLWTVVTGLRHEKIQLMWQWSALEMIRVDLLSNLAASRRFSPMMFVIRSSTDAEVYCSSISTCTRSFPKVTRAGFDVLSVALHGNLGDNCPRKWQLALNKGDIEDVTMWLGASSDRHLRRGPTVEPLISISAHCRSSVYWQGPLSFLAQSNALSLGIIALGVTFDNLNFNFPTLRNGTDIQEAARRLQGILTYTLGRFI